MTFKILKHDQDFIISILKDFYDNNLQDLKILYEFIRFQTINQIIGYKWLMDFSEK